MNESSNTNLLLCLFIAVLRTSVLFHVGLSNHNLTYNMAACTWWPQTENLVTPLRLIAMVFERHVTYSWLPLYVVTVASETHKAKFTDVRNV